MRLLDLDLLGPGCTVWESPTVRRDADGNRIGGVIVEMQDFTDLETGELMRRFQCFDTYRSWKDRLVMPVVFERDVDPDALEAPERHRLHVAILKLQAQTMRRIRHGHATMTPEEERWARWIGTLAAVLP